MKLFLDIVEDNGARYLTIRATDSCGGFVDERIPKMHTITFDKWTDYLYTLEEEGKHGRGMGFFSLLRYTTATGGRLLVDSVSGGASVIAIVGLMPEQES